MVRYRRVETAKVRPELLGGPGPAVDTDETGSDQQTQPDASPVSQEIVLDATYLEGFSGPPLSAARVAIEASMPPKEISDQTSTNTVIEPNPDQATHSSGPLLDTRQD